MTFAEANVVPVRPLLADYLDMTQPIPWLQNRKRLVKYLCFMDCFSLSLWPLYPMSLLLAPLLAPHVPIYWPHLPIGELLTKAGCYCFQYYCLAQQRHFPGLQVFPVLLAPHVPATHFLTHRPIAKTLPLLGQHAPATGSFVFLLH